MLKNQRKSVECQSTIQFKSGKLGPHKDEAARGLRRYRQIGNEKRASLLKTIHFFGPAQHSSCEAPLTSSGRQTPDCQCALVAGERLQTLRRRRGFGQRLRPTCLARVRILGPFSDFLTPETAARARLLAAASCIEPWLGGGLEV